MFNGQKFTKYVVILILMAQILISNSGRTISIFLIYYLQCLKRQPDEDLFEKFLPFYELFCFIKVVRVVNIKLLFYGLISL